MLAVKGRYNGATVVLDSIPPIKECDVIVNFPDVPASVKPSVEPQPSPQGVEPEVRGSPLAPQPSPQGEGSPLDDDEPVWRTGSLKSGTLDSAAQNNASAANESSGDESPVDRVLRIIPGTVIN